MRLTAGSPLNHPRLVFVAGVPSLTAIELLACNRIVAHGLCLNDGCDMIAGIRLLSSALRGGELVIQRPIYAVDYSKQLLTFASSEPSHSMSDLYLVQFLRPLRVSSASSQLFATYPPCYLLIQRTVMALQ